jgi:hypothetical protein
MCSGILLVLMLLWALCWTDEESSPTCLSSSMETGSPEAVGVDGIKSSRDGSVW